MCILESANPDCDSDFDCDFDCDCDEVKVSNALFENIRKLRVQLVR
jgi:hypothetical protein